ncbi:hypothetical protein B0T19DRAFT_116730 [Cercophora scortea]|uniref:Cytochrome b561 domain-containing protein n=1 Tax=Cercophora scortea TaxID=314031 RepID=A0AAE0IY82_9PEZI|nr:hypothetical protein B0T19DRAFT_116730 [Cercophora scortea]
MAPVPVDTLSPPGSSSYTSNTLTVGDGTWDFTKNTFLLPNLVGLNFDTMQYNGMGNRFSTLTQYHSLITAHGVLAAITFLFLVPIAVLIVRFHTSSPGYAVRYHAYLQVLAVGLSTVVFALGFFAVGPPRSLTNPHHGIGVAIYVLILLQAIGGRLVKHIRGRSFRVHVHRWSGRVVTLLGIVQVPLGLTLYGSPKYLFVLFAVWMGFLVFMYFVLDYRDQGRHEYLASGGRSEGGRHSEKSDRKSGMGWFAKIAAALGIWALFRGRKKTRDTERGLSRSPSPARSHRGRNMGPEVIPSPRQSETYYEDKHTERRASGGGFMRKVFGVGAGLGAGALVGKMMSGRNRGHDDEYSAVATDTPSRVRKPRRYEPSETEFSGRTEETHHHDGRQGRAPLLPAPSAPSAVTETTRPARPVTPQRSHAATSRFESIEGSDYSSYVSPSRRASERRRSGGGGVGKGLLAGIGLGWLAKKGKDSRDRREEDRLRDEEDRRRDEEEDRRAGKRSSRYTADGYPSPSRRESRRRPPRARPPPSAVTNTASILSEESSIEPRGDTFYEPAPVGVPRPMQPVPPPSSAQIPLVPAGSQVPVPVPGPPPPGGYGSRSQSRVRQDPAGPATMPAMPPDPQGFNHESGSETYYSSGGRPHRRHSSRQGAAGDGTAAAAAAAAAAAGLLAQEEEERRRRDRSRGGESSAPKPVSIKMKMHDDKDRNITLRRLTEEETAARRSDRRRRNDSVSSHSDGDTPTRYRRERERESSQRRAETAAEQRVEDEPLAPLSPPNPAFAQGRRPAGKDSAYYSGQPGPSGGVPAAGATVSSLGIGGAGGAAGSAGTWSAMSPTPSAPLRDPSASAASAADRRRRRRLERRDGSRTHGTVDFE